MICRDSLTFYYPCPFPTTNQQFNSKVSCSFLYSPVPWHCSGQLSPQCQHTFRHWHVRPQGNTKRTNLWLHRPSARALYLSMSTCQKWFVMLVAVILKRILGSYTQFTTIKVKRSRRCLISNLSNLPKDWNWSIHINHSNINNVTLTTTCLPAKKKGWTCQASFELFQDLNGLIKLFASQEKAFPGGWWTNKNNKRLSGGIGMLLLMEQMLQTS